MSNTVHAAAIQFSIPINVSTDNLVDAVAAGMIGGPHGYAYWCHDVLVRNQPDLSGEQIAHHVLAGGTATVRELVEGDDAPGREFDVKAERHTLTRAKLLTGFGRWVVEFQSGQGTYDAATGMTTFEIDAPASDAIMQFALFGEQKYG